MNESLEQQLDNIFGVTPQGTLFSQSIPIDAFVVKLIHTSDPRVLCPDSEVAERKEIDSLARRNLWHEADETTLAPDTNVPGLL